MTLRTQEIVLQPGWPQTAPEVRETGDGSRRAPVACVILTNGANLEAGELASVLPTDRAIRQVMVRTGEALSDEALAAVQKLKESMGAQAVPVSLDLVVPEEADVPAHARGERNWLAAGVSVSNRARKSGFTVRWLIPLTPRLIYRLDGLTSLALQNGAEPILLFPEFLGPPSEDRSVSLTPEGRLFAWDFVTYRLLDEDAGPLGSGRLFYFQRLAAELLHPGSEDTANLAALALAPAEEGARGKTLLQRRRETAGDIADVLTAGLPGHLLALLASRREGRKDSVLEGTQIPYALLIGAYGGEHIGDIAILGGVLHRIHRRYGTSRAILMTQRPPHTRHLVPMLDTPVEIEVEEYTLANIRRAVARTDGLVFAGGPLIDLPKQLVRHLSAASLAKKADKPFIMEGIGPSTFPRKPSQVTAKRLLSLADRVSLRTSSDAGRPVMEGFQPEIGRDPAFDYLATRGTPLTRLPAFERAQIDELLADSAGRLTVGINIRPIRDLYTPASPGRDKATYTREVEQRFEEEFARGLSAFAKSLSEPPCFVFFPMNAIQFGKSDLRSAHRIMAHLEPGVDFRVWEGDASLDGVVALIRRLDAVVSMRFHATIFALSQNKPVAGVDYRIGEPDKVTAVLADAGRAEDCCRIDELTADWLTNKLAELRQRIMTHD